MTSDARVKWVPRTVIMGVGLWKVVDQFVADANLHSTSPDILDSQPCRRADISMERTVIIGQSPLAKPGALRVLDSGSDRFRTITSTSMPRGSDGNPMKVP